jgi:beta-lactamase superfamily II metal-dependent hydrolase
MMSSFMRIRVWDVEHGACVMLQHQAPAGLAQAVGGRLAMIDSGSSTDFSPSEYIRSLGRNRLDYLFITNADQDHMSDLKGLESKGIEVAHLIRNPTYSGEEMRRIKQISGPLTDDAEWYVRACGRYSGGVGDPFNHYMGGITYVAFYNSYYDFKDTNNLSLAIFIKFAGFTMLLPGDLEKPGWRALLRRPDFVANLRTVDVLMASHHGRESGFCPEVFAHVTPQAIVISDKAMQHSTQETVPDYRRVTTEAGIPVINARKHRHVLTTRRDGWIQFDVYENGRFYTTTEHES